MKFLRELLNEETKSTKKKNKKDKTADKYTTYVSGNMMFNNTCSSDLSGTKKIEKDTQI